MFDNSTWNFFGLKGAFIRSISHVLRYGWFQKIEVEGQNVAEIKGSINSDYRSLKDQFSNNRRVSLSPIEIARSNFSDELMGRSKS